MDRFLQLIIFLDVLLLISTSANAQVKSVFVFGDSLFDPGNNYYIKNCTVQANFPPYGSTFFGQPTGRFTNGRTVADFIAQYLKIKFQKPYQKRYGPNLVGKFFPVPSYGLNFASAGSGILPETNKYAGVTPIQVQLQQFKGLIKDKHLHTNQTRKSLFLLAAGSHDIFTFFQAPDKASLPPWAYQPPNKVPLPPWAYQPPNKAPLPPWAYKPPHKAPLPPWAYQPPNKAPIPPWAYVNTMLKEVTHFIDKIYKHGARKIVIFSVGPMGCIPGRVTLPNANTNRCYDVANQMAKQYNAGLERLVYMIPRKYRGAVGVYAEVYNSAQNIRAHAKLHGFENVNEACCGAGTLKGQLQCGEKGYKKCLDPNKFFYWDYFNPSERTYELISKTFWSGGGREIRPMNLKILTNLTLRSF